MLLIERLLPRRNFGNSLVDRALSRLFRGRAGSGAFKNFPFATLTFCARLFVAQTADLLLLFSETALLMLCRIGDALATPRAFIAAWLFLGRGRTPLANGIPLPRQIIGSCIQPVVIVEVAVAITPRQSVGASELSVPPFSFIARLPLACSTIEMPLIQIIRLVASRNEL
jgi:hypothetical protein